MQRQKQYSVTVSCYAIVFYLHRQERLELFSLKNARFIHSSLRCSPNRYALIHSLKRKYVYSQQFYCMAFVVEAYLSVGGGIVFTRWALFCLLSGGEWWCCCLGMLCGEFHRAPLGLHLSLSVTRSPYTSLLALVQGMAAITAHAAHEDEDIFLGKYFIHICIMYYNT